MNDLEARRRERLRAAAGELAAGVVAQLVRPLRELREDLAVLVEVIDQHTTESRGPRGMTWKEIETLRQQLVRAYLSSRDTARLASELAAALSAPAAPPEAVDLNKLIESGIHLGAHRVAADSELFVDLGTLPPARAPAAEVTLLIASMVMLAAESASGGEHTAISIKTRREGDLAVVVVADNGRGAPAALDRLNHLAADVIEPLGGSFAGTSEAGAGSALELRLPLGRKEAG
jgi:C4-dicarboxylate-specific signal transduction histidine kinase